MTHISTKPSTAETRPTDEAFVFRSGGLFGSGKKVTSIRAAIKHMDRYPEDGIYHLRNGTLAQWLDAQGAEDLARLAREAIRTQDTDPRVTLERFLIGTGWVRRPRISLRPKAIALRYILAGQRAESVLRVRKGRGRGVLYGSLHTRQPWIRVDPIRFSGKPLEAIVTIDTETLPISKAPHAGAILVESSASEQPLAIPLRFRVVGAPSRLQRYGVRPLVSLLLAGSIGAALGALMAVSAVGFPTQFLAKVGLTTTAVGAWAAFVGVVWGMLGAILGFSQPLAWPVWYANARWLLRTLVWAATFTILVGIGLLTWQVVYPNGHLPAFAPSRVSTWLAAVALSIFPAALGELWSVRSTRHRTLLTDQQPLLRAGTLVLIASFLAVVLVAGIRLAGPAVQQVDFERASQIAQRTIEEQWVLFEGRVGRWVDELTLRLYDRRAKP